MHLSMCGGGKPITLEEGTMTNRKLSLIVSSFALATGIFTAGMLISPPVTMAVSNQGIDVARMALNAPKDLPSFDATYQRHTGVLDTLK
jgi:hypothetical protein